MDAQTEQLFPDLIPDIVVRIWKAVGRHYDTGTRLMPTREMIVRLLAEDADKPASLSTVDRARRDFPDLLPWPIKRGQQPPWLTRPDMLIEHHPLGSVASADGLLSDSTQLHLRWEASDEHGRRQTVEAVTDEHGVLRLVTRWRDTTATVAAALASFGLLDLLSDGRLDGVVHWCRLLERAAHILA